MYRDFGVINAIKQIETHCAFPDFGCYQSAAPILDLLQRFGEHFLSFAMRVRLKPVIYLKHHCKSHEISVLSCLYSCSWL